MKKKSPSSSKSSISGGGQMGSLIRAFHWERTSLGPITEWPQSLVTAVNLILQSPVPIVMLWGKDGIMLYNDGYSMFAGKRHPSLLGSKVLEGWPEVVEFNRNVMKHGLQGKTLSYTDQQLTLYRNNKPEEVWMDLNYSPVIDESGKPAGVLAIVIETTQRVLAEQKQKEAELRLQEESNRLQTLFMQAPAVIAVLRGKDHVFELANPLYMQLVGKDRSIIGKPVEKALPEVKKQGFIKLLDRVYRTGKPFVGNEIYIELQKNKKGKSEGYYLNFVYHPLTDAKGKVEGIFVHAVDVTEQVLIRLKIEESEDRFRTLIEKSSDAVQIVSPKGEILYTSESIKNVLGYTAEEMQDKAVLPFLHPDDHYFFKQEFSKLLSGKQKQIQLQYRVKHKDGSWAWLEVTGVNHLDTPNINALVGTFRNITERKQREEMLRESEAKFRSVWESVSDAIAISDENGVVLNANPSYFDLYGYAKDEIIGKDFSVIFPKEVQETAMKTYKEIFNGVTRNRTVESEIQRSDGTKRIVESSYDFIISNNTRVALVSTIRDITERKELERQKDDFLGIASHELKTPVTSIKAYGQALQAKFSRKGDTKAAEQLGKMDAQIDKLTNLIGDLLDVTKIQSGKMKFDEEIFDFNDLVEEIVEELQRTTEKHQLIKKLTKSKQILGDRERVGQVITNLISNAIKYSPNAKDIIISTASDKKNIRLCVQDFGVGIPDEKKLNVFEQFFRVSGPTQDTFPGLGLGLYISKEIVEREDGKIWVDSELGKGSTFCFTLPLKRTKQK